MYSRQPSRILHVDGDTFFASCEVALDASLSGKPVWVGGGRRGDGIVIAANREAKWFGIHTGMACFKAKHMCPHGVLARPQYDEYRRLSQAMFRIMEDYSPTLVPMSIDEGFLDLTTMGSHVWRDTTAADYVNGLRARIQNEVGLPVSAGLGRSTWMAKLATSAAKPGFVEVPPDCEKEFLADRHVSELAGVGKRRERSLAVLGARTFGDVAELSSTILKQKFGIWGQQLWLFANGQWNEPLLLEVKDRTTISSSTTLPYDEPDYEAALVFALSESTRMVGQLRREGLQAREMSLTIRFTDFIETGARHRFNHPQFRNSTINTVLEGLFDEVMVGYAQPVRQIRICFWNLKPLDTQPTLWGTTDAERWGALDEATQKLEGQWGNGVVLTGAQYALQRKDAVHANPKSKCPFVPAREMARKLWGEKLERLSRHHRG
ncbi:MAG: DNA polymerase IV [Pedosphaera sp.]|nr:DNA polymerase IV [Pedosphaera sp.]